MVVRINHELGTCSCGAMVYALQYGAVGLSFRHGTIPLVVLAVEDIDLSLPSKDIADSILKAIRERVRDKMWAGCEV